MKQEAGREGAEMTHCQICAREIKLLPSGRIAHHGYKRPYGYHYQTSSCLGAKHLPYEVSRDAIPPYRDALKLLLEETQVKFAELIGNPPSILTVRVKRDAWDAKGTLVDYARPAGFTVKQTVGGTRPRTYENAFANRHGELRSTIRNVSEDLKFLTERYDTWTLVTLEIA